MDMLLNCDNPGWKWAMWNRRPVGPIARDRDKAMWIMAERPQSSGRWSAANSLSREYPAHERTSNIDLDRRLLSGLETSAVDSMAVYLMGRDGCGHR